MSISLMVIAIVILVALSAFFSASEMVFSSANKLRIENAAEDGSSGAKLALHIMERFDDMLSAILVGNNLVNIATSSIGSVIAVTLWGEKWTWVMTIALTVTVIIFGETMPKIIAKKNANHWATTLCYPIRFLSILLKPVTLVVVGLVNMIMFLLPEPSNQISEEEAQQELQSIIETAEDEKVLDEDQSELLQAALEFDDIRISEVMTARVDIEALDIEDEMSDMMELVENSTFSRLPVYEGSIDHIIGVLSQNKLCRLLAAGEKANIRALLYEPVYFYKTTRLPAAIRALRAAQQHMGIVVDEYGGTMGIITIEDIMEQLVGEIWDEKDEVEPEEVVERSVGIYELDGDMQITDFAELMGFKESILDDVESATIGGLTTELFGTFPEPGDTVSFGGAEIKVLSRDGLRVDRVLVTLESDEDENTPQEA